MIKNQWLWSIASVLMFFFIACSEDIDLSPDGKETAVVYALLDQADSIHYVRINRAFYGGTNALEIAQIPDSSYFKKVDAYVYEVANGDTLRSWKLRDTLVSNKDTNGVFYAPQQKLYYFKTEKTTPLLAHNGCYYHLDAKFDNGRFSVQSKTELIRGNKIGTPGNLGNSFSFASSNIAKYGYFGTEVYLNTGNSYASNITLEILINEFYLNEKKVKSVIWDLGNVTSDINGINSITANGENFYKKIAAVCNDKLVSKRQLQGVNIQATFVSRDFIEYQNSLIPSSTITQTKREFTNLTVSNNMRVKGIFTSKSTLIAKKNNFDQYSLTYYYRAIDQSSMKELCNGQYTGLLNFCSDVPSDSKESFYCN